MVGGLLPGEALQLLEQVFPEVQQMHPLENSTTRSAVRTTRRASTFTSARSFTRTATRFPSSPVRRRWLIKVVLPAPRKPTRTVTGMGAPILLTP